MVQGRQNEKFEMTLLLSVDTPFSCVMDVFCKYTLPSQKSILILVDLSGKDEREKSVTEVERKGNRGKADVRKNTICRAAKKIIYRLLCTRQCIALKLNSSSKAAKLKFQRMTHRDQLIGIPSKCCKWCFHKRFPKSIKRDSKQVRQVVPSHWPGKR